MKFSVVKRQLLDDQVESAKSLLSYTSEIERKNELEFNPYMKNELGRLQKYVDQLSVKPKSPFSVYRRTEEEDISYCLHRKHSKSMNTLSGLIENINKELYRLKKLKQAEKKLEFLDVFNQNQSTNEEVQNKRPAQVQYKLPESKSVVIPQLSSPPKFDPISFHTEEEDKPPEMSRAMESFLIQQEKDRKEKEVKQKERKEKEHIQNHSEVKKLSINPKNLASSDSKLIDGREMSTIKSNSNNNIINNQNNNTNTNNHNKNYQNSNIKKVDQAPFTGSAEKNVESREKSLNEPPRRLSFAGLRQSGGPTYNSPHARPYTSSDPEIPYGCYSENGPYSHYISTFGRSSGTLDGPTKSDEKSRGSVY